MSDLEKQELLEERQRLLRRLKEIDLALDNQDPNVITDYSTGMTFEIIPFNEY